MGFEFIECGKLEGRRVGGAKNDPRWQARVVSFLPQTCAQAPVVSRIQARKFLFWPVCGVIVALVAGEFEKSIRHHGTHRMYACVSAARMTESIAVVSCERLVAAGF